MLSKANPEKLFSPYLLLGADPFLFWEFAQSMRQDAPTSSQLDLWETRKDSFHLKNTKSVSANNAISTVFSSIYPPHSSSFFFKNTIS
jgi:hypothetical protein